jgi:hypothetical protein
MSVSLARRLAGLVVATTVAVSVITVPGSAYADPTTGIITGQITRPDGSPAAGEQVFVERWTTSPVFRSATTDAGGAYTVSDLPAGDGYRVSVQRPAGRQYAHGVADSNLAEQFAVAAAGITTVDERLLPVGTIDLTLTEWTGEPAASASVILSDPSRRYSTFGSTNAAGRLTMAVFAGTFQVSVTPSFAGGGINFAREQFLHGRVPPARPDVITVAEDSVTAVAEQLLQPGALAVTARDAVTGAPIADFCVSHVAGGGCSDGSGSVTVADVRPGPFDLTITTDNGDYLLADERAVVVSGQTVPVSVALRRAGKLSTTIVAADTGAPVEGVCVELVKAGTGRLPDGSGDCSDPTGAVTLGRITPGDYHLFVRAPAGSGYGAQWVGRSGGVGTATRARTVKVVGGRTATVPTIRLDRAGTISGVVRSETGEPVTSGLVSLDAFGRVGPSHSVSIDGEGRYQIDWLGPYEWPLLFDAANHARQWSGGEADRRRAKEIRVRSGRTTTYNPTLRVGTVLTGTVTNAAGQPLTAEFDLINVATGEPMGGGFSPSGTYRSLVIGPQDVKLNWYAAEQSGWYNNASDFASATRIPIPRRGTKTLNLVLNV